MSAAPPHEPSNRTEDLDRNLALDLVRVTEAAAMAAGRWVGRGDKDGGDGAAVDAMRQLINSLPMQGVVVIGEGEKDNAPMLFNGEQVGDGRRAGGRRRGRPDRRHHADEQGHAERGRGAGRRRARARCSTRAPCSTWRSSPSGRTAPTSSTSTPASRRTCAGSPRSKRSSVSDVTVCILDRPRHARARPGGPPHRRPDPLHQRRRHRGRDQRGPRQSEVDVWWASAARPRASWPPCALKCIGGAIQAKLWPRDEAEREKALAAGHDLDRVLTPTIWSGRQHLLLRHRRDHRLTCCAASATAAAGRTPSRSSCAPRAARSG